MRSLDMKTNEINPNLHKTLPQTSSDDNNNPWEHDTSRQERDHVIYNDELDTVPDLELD